MYRIADCITVDHDIPLLLLAVVICVAGFVASTLVAGRVRGEGHAARWTVLLGVCAGATAWSTHFVSMLAYRTSLVVAYDPILTVASLIVGIGVMGFGCHMAITRRSSPVFRLLGGAIVGSGVVALHYLGMAGLQLPGELHYDLGYVSASVLMSLGFGAAALDTLLARRHAFSSPLAVGLLIAMTVSLHFTGMAALELQLHSVEEQTAAGASRLAIVVAVSLASLATLAIGTVAAIADRHLSNRLAAEAERFRTLSDGAFEGLIVHRNGAIVDVNIAARKLLSLDDSTPTYPLNRWIDGIETPLRPDEELIDEVDVRCLEGETFPAEICRRRIRLADGAWGELIAIRDLTARKKSDATIAHLALHDPLTDLPNRRLFAELAASALERAARTDCPFAMLAVDLDNFKIVNDIYGHDAGDQLIRVVAERITGILGDGDVVARLGGDEFALLATSEVQPDGAGAMAQRILNALAEPVLVDSGGRVASLSINASIGIAVYPFDGRSIDEMLRNADTAMYRAKAGGKGSSRFFEAGMNEALESRHRIELGLRRAIEAGTLKLAYQPLVSSNAREPICFEALLRWTDEELGEVEPAVFIPVAEACGLIMPIGELVLRQACRDACQWPAPMRVAVNLSAAQFKGDDLIDIVQNALAESGLPGERLELEVTESLLIENRDKALEQLNALKALGIRIAMDDFGTGYSSLSYLRSFRFDKLKIDRYFVANLEGNAQNASIVQAVVSMGQSLSMQVVAEGVETAEQAAALSEMSCDQLQGFLIAKPMAAHEVQRFLASPSSRLTGLPRAAGEPEVGADSGATRTHAPH